MSQKNYILIITTLFFIACSTIPITNRKSVKLLPNSMMLSMSIASYQDFLNQNPPLPSSDARVQEVQKVGNDISQGVIQFLNDNKMAERVDDFTWEFNVVEDETVNAWCMPGGKIVFYSGILPVTEGLNGIATVMGHEIAHAVAQHGNERMTQQLAIYMGAVTLDYALANEPEKTRDIFLLAYGAGSQLGSLAYSRTHEYEADKLGMVFMAMSNYDPAYAIDFWQRMAQIGGAKPPEFLSTHPSDENRVEALRKFLPEAQKYYKTGKKSGGTIRL